MFSADIPSQLLESPHLPELVEALRRWSLDDQVRAKYLTPEAPRIRGLVEKMLELIAQYDPDAIEADLAELDDVAGRLGKLRRHLEALRATEVQLAERVEKLRAKLTHADSIQRKIRDRTAEPRRDAQLIRKALEPELAALGFLPNA